MAKASTVLHPAPKNIKAAAKIVPKVPIKSIARVVAATPAHRGLRPGWGKARSWTAVLKGQY